MLTQGSIHRAGQATLPYITNKVLDSQYLGQDILRYMFWYSTECGMFVLMHTKQSITCWRSHFIFLPFRSHFQVTDRCPSVRHLPIAIDQTSAIYLHHLWWKSYLEAIFGSQLIHGTPTQVTWSDHVLRGVVNIVWGHYACLIAFYVIVGLYELQSGLIHDALKLT